MQLLSPMSLQAEAQRVHMCHCWSGSKNTARSRRCFSSSIVPNVHLSGFYRALTSAAVSQARHERRAHGQCSGSVGPWSSRHQDPEGPSTQMERYLVPNTVPMMALGA